MIVLDASLAVKLIIDEADSDAADRWYSALTVPVEAPDILAIEVAQAVVRRINSREMVESAGRASLVAWQSIFKAGAITLCRMEPAQFEAAIEMALTLGHPLKDCIYLALAMERGTTLMTCDAKFAAKARMLYPAVKLLADHA